MTFNQAFAATLPDHKQLSLISAHDLKRRVFPPIKWMVEDLIPEGAVTSDTRLVLSNAIYFKATWMEPFDKNLTELNSYGQFVHQLLQSK